MTSRRSNVHPLISPFLLLFFLSLSNTRTLSLALFLFISPGVINKLKHEKQTIYTKNNTFTAFDQLRSSTIFIRVSENTTLMKIQWKIQLKTSLQNQKKKNKRKKKEKSKEKRKLILN